MVREVPAMLQAHLKTIDELIRCGERVLFEILRSAAEEAAVVLKVFESAGERKLRREVILQVSDAADYMRRRAVGEVTAYDMVEFAGDSKFVGGGPA